MTAAPEIPGLYRYAFLTSRAVGMLPKRPDSAADANVREELREVLAECKALVEKLIRGEEFLIGPIGEVHNLRPDDVAAFNYVFITDAHVKKLAENADNLRNYFKRITGTLDLVASGKAVPGEQLGEARAFLTRLADALIHTAREKMSHTRVREPILAGDE